MRKENEMNMKKWIILLAVILAGFTAGRLLVRFVMNLMLGGTLFGGDFL